MMTKYWLRLVIQLRNRPLAEGIVQHRVDAGRRDAQARRRLAIDRQRELGRGGLLIARQVVICGSFAKPLCTIGAHRSSSAKSTSVSVYWYCVAVSRPPILTSCTGCMNNRDAGNTVHRLAPSRAMTVVDRCALGLWLESDE